MRLLHKKTPHGNLSSSCGVFIYSVSLRSVFLLGVALVLLQSATRLCDFG